MTLVRVPYEVNVKVNMNAWCEVCIHKDSTSSNPLPFRPGKYTSLHASKNLLILAAVLIFGGGAFFSKSSGLGGL